MTSPEIPEYPEITKYSDDSESLDAFFAVRAELDRIYAPMAEKMGYFHHITRIPQMSAEPLRAEREGEWLPEEVFEPMESTTGRSPFNWDI